MKADAIVQELFVLFQEEQSKGLPLRRVLEAFSNADKPADPELFLAAVRARSDLNAISVKITKDDLERWRRTTNQTDAELLNDIASNLAFGFQAREFDFNFCDMVVNRLDQFADRGDRTADVFWKVWHAFDTGEFYREGHRDEDPSEAYTRPEIEKIVAKLKSIN